MKTNKLKKLNACSDAIKWVAEQKNQQQAWDDCERGDWMLWLVGKLSEEPESKKRKKLVLAACECARLALPCVAEGELSPLQTIETAERWARGKSDIAEVRSAATAADAAYADAYAAACAAAAAAAAAAYAAAYAAAAYAAYAADAADAAYVYADAFAAADAVAAAAADAAARKETLKKCADIVRKHYPKVPKF